MHAGVLHGVAHARSLARADVRRHPPGGQAKAQRDAVAPAQRSPSALDKLATRRIDDGMAAHSFRHADGPSSVPSCQDLTHTQRRRRCAHVRDPHHAQRRPASRAGSDQADPHVDRKPKSRLMPSAYGTRTNLGASAAGTSVYKESRYGSQPQRPGGAANMRLTSRMTIFTGAKPAKTRCLYVPLLVVTKGLSAPRAARDAATTSVGGRLSSPSLLL